VDEQVSDEAPARLTGAASWLITQTAVHASRLVADGFGAVGARGHHYRIMAAVAEFGPASQATLARHSGMYVSDVVATINELAKDDYVSRSPDPGDRRRNIVALTDAGRARLRDLDAQLARLQDELLAPLDADEREQLTLLLGRLLDHHAARARA